MRHRAVPIMLFFLHLASAPRVVLETMSRIQFLSHVAKGEFGGWRVRRCTFLIVATSRRSFQMSHNLDSRSKLRVVCRRYNKSAFGQKRSFGT